VRQEVAVMRHEQHGALEFRECGDRHIERDRIWWKQRCFHQNMNPRLVLLSAMPIIASGRE